MARLSTGQFYGEASRASAAQLLGGIPTEASGEALAQGSINAPSLQPRATPVDTFQRVGAPTLGGAPKIFAPPDLPNPGQDLANLSKALGGFSSTLQNFGETWIASKKEEGKRMEEATGALVGQASRFGPARELADLAANLEKAAALGNPAAARMLQVVREKQNKSVGKYWLERSIEQNAIQSAALGLPDLIANTSVIKGTDGKDYDSNTLSSDDPVYRAYRDERLFGGVQMSNQGYAKNQGIIVQAQLQADQIQRKKYNTAQAVGLAGQVTVNTQKAAEKYVLQRATGRPEDAEDAATMSLQQSLDAIRILPGPEETKTKMTNEIMENFAAEVGSAAKFSEFSFVGGDMDAVLRPVLSRLMTGPVDQRVKADGVTANESLRLFNTLGGNQYLDQLVAKANQGLIQDKTQQAQMAEIQEQQAFDARLAAGLPEGRRSDPAAINSFFQTEREQAAAEPNAVLRAARFSRIDASERQLTETYVKPVQDKKFYALTRRLDKSRDSEAERNALAADVQTLLHRNEISSAQAINIQTTLTAQNSSQVRSYRKDISKRVDDILKPYEEYIKSPNSYDGQSIAGFEAQSAYNARSMATRRLEDAVDQAINDGKDPTEAMNKVQLNNNFGLRRREEVGGTQAPTYDNTTELIRKNTGNWSRSTIAPREANQLRSSAKVRPLMKLEPWDRDVTALLNGNASQNFRTLMKTLTTGTGGQKPSEVILNQFKLLGIEVPENERLKFQALDGQEISRATPARRQSPQQNGALAGIQIVGGALGNLLVPPAQAQAAPPPKPATNFPALVTQVGYYAGGGGQDGVAGGRTANGEIYNPKKMTVAVQWTLRGKLLNKWLLVQDSKSNKTVRVWANDVGPLLGDNKRTGARHLDLSSAAFTKLFGSTRQGLGDIKYKVDPDQGGRP